MTPGQIDTAGATVLTQPPFSGTEVDPAETVVTLPERRLVELLARLEDPRVKQVEYRPDPLPMAQEAARKAQERLADCAALVRDMICVS